MYSQLKVCMNNDDILQGIQVTIDCTHAVLAYFKGKNYHYRLLS